MPKQKPISLPPEVGFLFVSYPIDAGINLTTAVPELEINTKEVGAKSSGVRWRHSYWYPAERAMWLSNLPHFEATAIVLIVAALFLRWGGRLVDGIQRKLAA